MFRTLFSGLLLLAVVAEAAAQTTPTGSTTAAAKTTTRRPTSTAPRPATAKTAGATSKKMARSPEPTAPRQKIGPRGNGAVGSGESADGKGQGMYAAPGTPVNVSDPKQVSSYDNKPAGKLNRTTGSTITPR